MRNESAKLALQMECDYLLFIDDDVIVHEDTFTSLLSANKDIVMALTFLRSYPFQPMLFIDRSGNEKEVQSLQSYENYADHIIEDGFDEGLVQCDAVGFSCALIKCELLKKLEPPYFVTIPNQCTEDIYFCVKAQRVLGKKNVSIFTDTRVPTGHLGEKFLCHVDTVGKLRDYFKPDKEIADGIAIDRGTAYAEYVEAESRMRIV